MVSLSLIRPGNTRHRQGAVRSCRVSLHMLIAPAPPDIFGAAPASLHSGDMADDPLFDANERNSSPTCSMNSVPTHRPSSTRGRRTISPRTWYCASTSTSRHQGSSCAVRGAASPNDEEPHLRVKTSPGSLQRSARTATRFLPHRLGAAPGQPRPPRGCAPSQRSWSSNQLARDGCGALALHEMPSQSDDWAARQPHAR